MGFLGLGKNAKEGGAMDVIKCEEKEYLVWKWRPSEGELKTTLKENAIRFGSILKVRQTEMAVFVYKQEDGKLIDYIKGPYEGMIRTANFPVLSKIFGAAYNGDTPFQAEVFFFNLQGSIQIPFAIPYFDVGDSRDDDLTVPVAVRGTILFNISDYDTFIEKNRLIHFDLESLKKKIKSTITRHTTEYVANYPEEHGISVLKIAKSANAISDSVAEKLTGILCENFGVNLVSFDIEAIEVDKDSPEYQEFYEHTLKFSKERKASDTEYYKVTKSADAKDYDARKRLQREAEYMQQHVFDTQADVLKTAANNLGQMSQINAGDGGMNAAGLFMGMAMGKTIGNQFNDMMGGLQNTAQQQISQTPPPMPNAATYHVSMNGQQFGPYNAQQIQQLVQSGQITANTYIWKPGMPNWDIAANIPELQVLFMTNTPPPPPPPPMM